MLQTYGMGGGRVDSRSAGLFTGRTFMLHRDCVVGVTNIRGKGGGSRLVDSFPNGKTFMLNFTNTYVAV